MDTLRSFVRAITYAALMSLVLLCSCSQLWAQKKTDKKDDKLTIFFDHNNYAYIESTDSGDVQKLVGDVILRQGSDTMYCDSMFMKPGNNIEAFGNVRIVQHGGTRAESDYLRYQGNSRVAYMKGNVKITDGKNNLWTEDLTYNVGTKIGVYTQGGTLQADSTTVSSNEGNYNANTKYARFIKDVLVTDPRYEVVSGDLGYYTETKVVQFFAPSVVTSDKSVLRTSGGTYDSNNEKLFT